MNEFREKFIKEYLNRIRASIEEMEKLLPSKIDKILNILLEARDKNRTVFIMGNGGSASTASHFVCDLAKGTITPQFPRFRVVGLADNIPLMLAWGNDMSYESIFVEQLKGLLDPHDVVIGISGSGNSQNVINAMKYANEKGAVTIGFTGFDGGKLKEIVQECILVPSRCMQHIEDIHLLLEHLITSMIRKDME